MAVRAIPEGFHSVTPSMPVDGARKFIDFIRRTRIRCGSACRSLQFVSAATTCSTIASALSRISESVAS